MGRPPHPSDVSRRQAVALLGATGAVLPLTGCIGDDDADDVDPEVPTAPGDVDVGDVDDVERDDETDPDDDPDDVLEQDFVLHMETNPEEASFWLYYDDDRYFEEGVDVETRIVPTGPCHAMQFDANFNGSRTFYFAPTDRYPAIAEASIVEGEELETERADRGNQYEILDQYRFEYDRPVWSDGEPIVASDMCPGAFTYRYLGDWPYDALGRGMGEAQQRGAWEEIIFPDDWDGQVVQFSDPWGALEDWSLNRMRYAQNIRIHNWDVSQGLQPTHVEPGKSGFENTMEDWDRWIENPDEFPARQWHYDNHIKEPAGTYTVDDIVDWQDPDEVICHGQWEPTEVRGAEEVILEPNPEWYGPEPNWERIRCVYAEAEERQVAELMAGRLDYYPHSLPSEVWDQVPDELEPLETEIDASGEGVGMDHSDPHLGNREVRAAMNKALDKEFVAEAAGHAELAFPINVIGWDNPFSDLVGGITREWAEENLVDYTYDPDVADAQMQAEGYERNADGTWVYDGEPLQYEFLTDDDDVEFEVAVTELWSEWGLDVDVRSVDSATFSDHYEQGDLDMWESSRAAADFVNVGMNKWRRTTGSLSHLPAYGMFSDEDIEVIEEEMPAELTVISDFELCRHLTIDLPPIGEPDAEPGAITLEVCAEPRDNYYNVRRDELAQDADYWQRYYWLANWYLADIPVYVENDQVWINMENWDYSRAQEHPEMWEFHPAPGFGPRARPGWSTDSCLLSSGWVQADPDNPK